MINASELVFEPFFYRGVEGRVFCLYVGPRTSPSGAVGGVLFVPPFAEEMNRARRQVILQARSFAAVGYGVLIMDLFGTGDSEGDFVQARWNVWLADLLGGVSWFENRSVTKITVWGVRWGALLAAELVRELGKKAQRLILWQPVLSGRQYMDQFIRLRVASSLLQATGGTTVHDLRQALENGNTVEIAGYELHPDLVRQIDNRSLSAYHPESELRVEWLEIVHDADSGLGFASKRVISSWGTAGAQIHAAVISGQPFWTTPEVTVVPGLIAHTTARLMGSA